jgi:hypothetical protein
MKKILIVAALLAVVLTFTVLRGTAQDKAAAGKYEYAIVKWDGPDRLFYNLPDKFEMVHIAKMGVKIRATPRKKNGVWRSLRTKWRPKAGNPSISTHEESCSVAPGERLSDRTHPRELKSTQILGGERRLSGS